MARIDEIAPDLYRVSIYMPRFDLQFNHFLIKDDEPLLFHTGMRRMFPEVRDAIATLIDPATLRFFFGVAGVWRAILNSVLVALMTMAMAILLGAPAGYALARFRTTIGAMA